MRVRRQTASGQVDAPPIEQLAAGRDGDEHRRVAVLGDTDGGGRGFSRHVAFRADGPRRCTIAERASIVSRPGQVFCRLA
jgi:hypothetical protein